MFFSKEILLAAAGSWQDTESSNKERQCNTCTNTTTHQQPSPKVWCKTSSHSVLAPPKLSTWHCCSRRPFSSPSHGLYPFQQADQSPSKGILSKEYSQSIPGEGPESMVGSEHSSRMWCSVPIAIPLTLLVPFEFTLSN